VSVWGGNATGAFVASTALAHGGWLAVCAISALAASAALVSSIWANVVKNVSYTILPSDTFITVLVDSQTGVRTITFGDIGAQAVDLGLELSPYLFELGLGPGLFARADRKIGKGVRPRSSGHVRPPVQAKVKVVNGG